MHRVQRVLLQGDLYWRYLLFGGREPVDADDLGYPEHFQDRSERHFCQLI